VAACSLAATRPASPTAQAGAPTCTHTPPLHCPCAGQRCHCPSSRPRAVEEARDKDATTPYLTLSRSMVSPPAEVVTVKADGKPPSPSLVVPCQRSWELGAGLEPPMGVCCTGYFRLARHEIGPWARTWAVTAARGLPRHGTMGCRTGLGTTRT
jgi:hypothetical protein